MIISQSFIQTILSSLIKESKEIKENKTPRTTKVICSITKCIWHEQNEREDGLGNCGKIEAWNIVPEEIEETEVDGDMTSCIWYNGMTRRQTIASVTPKF